MSKIFENLGEILTNTFTVPPEQMELPNLPHVFTVHHAISGMGDILGTGEEEARTAGFMGVWSSTIGFYNFISALDNIGPQKVLWNALGKSSESAYGSDFGIAFQMTRKVEERNVNFYRMAYFQAKNNDSKSEIVLNISQLSGGTSASLPEKNSALKQLENWIREKATHKFKRRVGPEYQIYSLCRADKDFFWTHYVVWDEKKLFTVPSNDVFQMLCRKGIHKTDAGALAAESYSMKFRLDGNSEGEDFLKPVMLKDLLIQAISTEHVGWREVPVRAAAKIIADFTELGGSWFIESDSGDSGGMVEALKEKSVAIKKVDPSIPVENYVKQTVNSLQSNQENASKVTPQYRKPGMG